MLPQLYDGNPLWKFTAWGNRLVNIVDSVRLQQNRSVSPTDVYISVPSETVLNDGVIYLLFVRRFGFRGH